MYKLYQEAKLLRFRPAELENRGTEALGSGKRR